MTYFSFDEEERSRVEKSSASSIYFSYDRHSADVGTRVAPQTRGKVTASQYRALPATGPRFQLIAGELVRMPAPSFRHQEVVAALIQELRAFVMAHGLGRVVGSPVDVYLSDEDVVQPDVLFISVGRSSRIMSYGVRGAPDLAVEVLSPSTRDLDLGAKRDLYAEYGVIEFWTVDTDKEVLSVHDLRRMPATPIRLVSASQAVTSDLLPGFNLRLERIFR